MPERCHYCQQPLDNSKSFKTWGDEGAHDHCVGKAGGDFGPYPDADDDDLKDGGLGLPGPYSPGHVNPETGRIG